MTFDELVDTLREEYKNLCAYLTDFDEATTGLCIPGGTIADVKRALWNINDCYHNAFCAVDKYVAEHKETEQ